MQVINTSNYGELTFERTWTDGTIHIGRLVDGGYCHIGGPPVASKTDLEKAIPSGKHLDEALNWWENKDKVQVKKDRPKIVMQEDGSYVFDDGSPIKSVADFVAYLPPGPALDAAVLWYVETYRDEIEKKAIYREDIDKKTLESTEELKKRTCICGKVLKNAFGLEIHQNTCEIHKAAIQKVP
jgi:hypothetical protein